MGENDAEKIKPEDIPVSDLIKNQNLKKSEAADKPEKHDRPDFSNDSNKADVKGSLQHIKDKKKLKNEQLKAEDLTKKLSPLENERRQKTDGEIEGMYTTQERFNSVKKSQAQHDADQGKQNQGIPFEVSGPKMPENQSSQASQNSSQESLKK